jgi:hypothetical protein
MFSLNSMDETMEFSSRTRPHLVQTASPPASLKSISVQPQLGQSDILSGWQRYLWSSSQTNEIRSAGVPDLFYQIALNEEILNAKPRLSTGNGEPVAGLQDARHLGAALSVANCQGQGQRQSGGTT